MGISPSVPPKCSAIELGDAGCSQPVQQCADLRAAPARGRAARGGEGAYCSTGNARNSRSRLPAQRREAPADRESARRPGAPDPARRRSPDESGGPAEPRLTITVRLVWVNRSMSRRPSGQSRSWQTARGVPQSRRPAFTAPDPRRRPTPPPWARRPGELNASEGMNCRSLDTQRNAGCAPPASSTLTRLNTEGRPPRHAEAVGSRRC